jgi:hypothetical protein
MRRFTGGGETKIALGGAHRELERWVPMATPKIDARSSCSFFFHMKSDILKYNYPISRRIHMPNQITKNRIDDWVVEKC